MHPDSANKTKIFYKIEDTGNTIARAVGLPTLSQQDDFLPEGLKQMKSDLISREVTDEH